ncbi:MAG: hypothetical protein KKH28_08600, partial [Elusimicrobia bacterium]|nr:hypothetical protein [Elusimicrobiota bacterium]
MIEERNDIFDSKITLHDKHRFEIKLDMDLPPSPESFYEVESYFFVPRALNIGPQTYTKEDFYNNNQRYIRFKTPAINLARLCDPGLAVSPLNKIQASLEKILSGSKDPKLVNTAYEEFKLLGCIIRGEIRDYVKMFMAGLEACKPSAAAGRPGGWTAGQLDGPEGEGLQNFVRDLKCLINRIKLLKTSVFDPAVPVKLRDTFAFFDEYFSLIMEEYLTGLLAALRNNASSPAGFKEFEAGLAELIISQNRHRAAMNYPSVLKETFGNESIIYRRGVLKKFISSALYLKTEVDEGQTLTQILFGAAAGLAMLFAVLAAIYAQNRYTINSVPFVLVIVASYIFKDRIKDWLKLLFSKNLTRWTSDREIKILDPGTSGKIGVLKEAFTFISERAVPPDISRIRNIDNLTSIDEDGKPERVFKYKKEIILYPKKILKVHDRRKDLHDIMRFNIKDFISQADDSQVSYPYIEPETGAVKTAACARVYHMNLVIKYSYADAAGQLKIHYDRIRIVLNKEGLVRLEEVKV